MADSDSDFSEESAPDSEDEKMNQLLAEWDERDEAKKDADVYVDSDEEEDDDDRAKKAALKKKADDSDVEDEDDFKQNEDFDFNDNDDEEEEEVVEEIIEEEVVEEEEEVVEDKKKKKKEKKEKKKEKKEKKKKDKKERGVQSATSDELTYMTADTDDVDEDPEPIVDELKKKPKKKKEKVKSKKITDPDEDDDEEDAAMKQLLANWDAEQGVEDDDDDDDDDDDVDDDESSEASEREVILDDNVLDHIVLAAPDLEEAMGEFEKKTGLAAVIAGTIKGLGIKCARISFTDSTYLEIIAPDPKAPGPIGELLKSRNIDELTPFHYAIRTTRAEELKDEVSQFGYTPDHITMFGAKADGTPRKWEMLYLYGHRIGGACPFFINWANSDHPCATLPVVGKLKKLTIRAPEDDPVHQLLEHVGVNGINVEVGDKPKLAVSFTSPEGTIKFSTHKAIGFKFPGFEADVGVIPGDEGEQDADVVFEEPAMPQLLPVDDEEEPEKSAADDSDDDDESGDEAPAYDLDDDSSALDEDSD